MTHLQEKMKSKLIIFFTIMTALAGCSNRTVLLQDFKDDQIIHHS